MEAENVEAYVLVDDVRNTLRTQLTIPMTRRARTLGIERDGNQLLLAVLVDPEMVGKGAESRTFVIVKGNREEFLRERLNEVQGTPIGTVLLPDYLACRAYELPKVIMYPVSQVPKAPSPQTISPASAAA